MDAEIGAHGHFDAVEHEGLLSDAGRGARRRRREQGVDAGKQFEHPLAIPTPEFLRLGDERGRDHRARDQAVAHRRIEIARALAQAPEMERATFARVIT